MICCSPLLCNSLNMRISVHRLQQYTTIYFCLNGTRGYLGLCAVGQLWFIRRGHEVYLNEKEAAKLLGFAVQSLRNWRHQRRGPAYLVVNARSIRYRVEDLKKFIEARRIDPEERL